MYISADNAVAPHICRSGSLAIFTNALGRAPLVAAAGALGWELEGAVPWAKYAARSGVRPNSSANEVLLRVYEAALIFRTRDTLRAPTHLTRGGLALLSAYRDGAAGGAAEGAGQLRAGEGVL